METVTEAISTSLGYFVRGGGNDDSEESDEDPVPSVSLPSYAPTFVSGWPGDRADDEEPVTLEFNALNADEFTVGEWSEQIGEVTGRLGTIGVGNGNWGNKWHSVVLEQYMRRDIKSSPCSIICMQEATENLFDFLKTPKTEGVQNEGGEPKARGGGKDWKERPGSEFIGFKGIESGPSLLIVARASIVQAMRLLLFRLRHDGLYKVKTKANKKKKEKGKPRKKMAVTRIMVVSMQMRFYRDAGGGGAVVTVNVHLHHETAKKGVEEGSHSLKLFFDELAEHITKYCARFLAGDFNMALFQVVPELRARGIQINLAAWFPWKKEATQEVVIDSCAIFVIGGVDGARKVFDASCLALPVPDVPKSWRNVMHVLKDEKGRDIGEEEIEISTFNREGAGFPLKSYRPCDHRIETLVKCSMEPACHKDSPAMAGIIARSDTDKSLFPHKIRHDIGDATWDWPPLPPCKQKLVDISLFDPYNGYFHAGAHMPLMMFMGKSHDSRRTPEKSKERYQKGVDKGILPDPRSRGSKTPATGPQTSTTHATSAGASAYVTPPMAETAHRRWTEPTRDSWEDVRNNNWQDRGSSSSGGWWQNGGWNEDSSQNNRRRHWNDGWKDKGTSWSWSADKNIDWENGWSHKDWGDRRWEEHGKTQRGGEYR